MLEARGDMATTDHRMTEAEFRGKAPGELDGIELIQISRFDPGSIQLGVLPAAAALTRTDGQWSTHTLVCRDADSGRFRLIDGHYDLDHAQAVHDMRTRSLG